MFDYEVRNSNMWREIHEQPRLMKDTISKNRDSVKNISAIVKERGITKVVLVGRGSSEHALLVGKYAFEIYTEMTATMAAPSVVTQYDGKMSLKDTLTIGISQCGEAQDVCAILKKCQDEGGIAVSITNERECLMKNVGNYYLNCECGKETSCTAAKSYMSQMILTLLFVAYISNDKSLIEDIERAPDTILHCVDGSLEMQIKNCMPLFRNTRDILLLARGLSFAVAHESELKIMEASYTYAKTYSTCDYPHGPIATTDRFVPAIFFLTDKKTNASSLELLKKMQTDFKISALVVTNNKEYAALANCAVLLPEDAEGISSVFALSVFSQMFACLLSLARGYNPDAPIGLSKTTVTF